MIKSISEVPVDAKDRPKVPIAISNCGELELRKKQDDASHGELITSVRTMQAKFNGD